MIASFLWELAPWNLENIRKSTNNLSFLCQFFINEITASDAGPDIIRSHLLFTIDTPVVVSGDRLLIINPTEDTHRVCHNVSLDKLTSTYRSTLYPVLKQIFKMDAGGTFGFDESCLEKKYFSGAFFILTLVFQCFSVF